MIYIYILYKHTRFQEYYTKLLIISIVLFSNVPSSITSNFSVQIRNEVKVFYMDSSEKRKTQSFSIKFEISIFVE